MKKIFSNLRRSLFLIAFLLTCNGEVVSKKRVCVVGAGRAGLAAVKLVSDEINKFDVVAFERNSDVGGIWIYRDNKYLDEHGLPAHSGIYKNLETNLPTALMQYPDYIEIENVGQNPDYVSHEKYLRYLKNYTDYFHLRKYIKFDTLVTKVIPEKGNGDWRTTTWRIDLRDLNTNQETTTKCNAVILCNGRYSKPNMPLIPGLFETFPGEILHSRTYRKPEDFMDRTVVVLGARNSGVDIAFDLDGYAKKVYLSHRHPEKDPLEGMEPNDIQVVRGVVSAQGSRLTLQDNSTIEVDTFIYCTGYLLDFPFLDERSGIVVENNRVRPLYRKTVNVQHPSMIIVGLPTNEDSFHGLIYYNQVVWFMGLLEGDPTLPSYDVMMTDANNFGKFYQWED